MAHFFPAGTASCTGKSHEDKWCSISSSVPHRYYDDISYSSQSDGFGMKSIENFTSFDNAESSQQDKMPRMPERRSSITNTPPDEGAPTSTVTNDTSFELLKNSCLARSA
jgi:hypothetical protein